MEQRQSSHAVLRIGLIIYSALAVLRLLLRLASGPRDIGPGASADGMGVVMSFVMVMVLAISLINFKRIFGEEAVARGPIIAVLVAGLGATFTILVLKP